MVEEDALVVNYGDVLGHVEYHLQLVRKTQLLLRIRHKVRTKDRHRSKLKKTFIETEKNDDVVENRNE